MNFLVQGARANWATLQQLTVASIYRGASAIFSPSNCSGPFRTFAFLIDPSPSRWKSITTGWLVMKKRVSDSGNNS